MNLDLFVWIDVTLKVIVGEELHLATVSIGLRDIDTLRRNGTEELVNRVYPGMEVEPEEGYDLAVQINMDEVGDPEGMLMAASDIKRNVLGGPIHTSLMALKSGGSGSMDRCKIQYRPNEWIYVCPSSDRVVIILSVDMMDDTDRALARVFLQAFVDSQVMYSFKFIKLILFVL